MRSVRPSRRGVTCDWTGYNVVNPAPFAFSAVFDWLQWFGYQMSAVPYAEWRARLLTGVESGAHADNALAPILTQFSPQWVDGLVHSSYTVTNLLSALEVPVRAAQRPFHGFAVGAC